MVTTTSQRLRTSTEERSAAAQAGKCARRGPRKHGSRLGLFRAESGVGGQTRRQRREGTRPHQCVRGHRRSRRARRICKRRKPLLERGIALYEMRNLVHPAQKAQTKRCSSALVAPAPACMQKPLRWMANACSWARSTSTHVQHPEHRTGLSYPEQPQAGRATRQRIQHRSPAVSTRSS